MTGTIHRKYKGWIQAILLLLIVGFTVWRVSQMLSGSSFRCAFESRVPVDELVYVEHARCRMACRDISQSLVEEVYLEGELNCRKSSPSADGHSRYALEKRDPQGDMIRIIVENDGGQHVIVTAIRLNKPDDCTCS